MVVSHLHPYTQRLMAHLDDVERVQHCDRVRQLVADGVGVAAERANAACSTVPVNPSPCSLGQEA